MGLGNGYVTRMERPWHSRLDRMRPPFILAEYEFNRTGKEHCVTAPDLLTIQLPRDAAELVERNVAPGKYPSASDVISESLRLLAERDKSLDRWLRDDVLGGHAEYLADRDRGVPAGEILQRIHHRRALKKLG